MGTAWARHAMCKSALIAFIAVVVESVYSAVRTDSLYKADYV
jgi:hypothetical protein